MKKKIFIAGDHAGFEFKTEVYKYLKDTYKETYDVEDLGPSNSDSVDYPDFADLVCQKLKSNSDAIGILICGSGQGMAIRANKYTFIRAALIYNEELAKLSREHNDANVICIGSRYCSVDNAKKWTTIFLNTPFAGGRHQTRVAKIGSSIS